MKRVLVTGRQKWLPRLHNDCDNPEINIGLRCHLQQRHRNGYADASMATHN